MKIKKNYIRKHKDIGKGFYEKANPITQKAPVHQANANFQTLERQGFIGNNPMIIAPRHQDNPESTTLNFQIEKKDLDNFVKWSLEYAQINKLDDIPCINTDTGKKDIISVIIPVSHSIQYPLWLIEKGVKLKLVKSEAIL